MLNLLSDKKLFKICTYIVASFVTMYVCKYLVDGMFFAVTNIGRLLGYVAFTTGKVLKITAIVVFGFLIAYILDPIVNSIQNRLKINRTLSTSLLYLIITVTIIVIATRLINKILIYDKTSISKAISLAYTHYRQQFIQLYDKIFKFIRQYDFFSILSSGFKFLKGLKFNSISTIQCIGRCIVNLFLSLVISFYFLRDKNRILKRISICYYAFMPQKIQQPILNVLKSIDTVLSGYIRGQLTDAVIMSILIASSLSILKIPFATSIGIISGFTNVIPYFGALVGLVLSAVTALISQGIGKAAVTVVVLLILQQIDSIIIVPKIVGENVRLSPVMVIISLGIAGNLFGIWGMVFAVPTAALLKTFGEKWLERIKKP